MTVYRFVLLPVLALLLAIGSHTRGSAEEPNQLKVGETTISYPTGLESQAAEVAKAVGEVLPACFERHRKLKEALNSERIGNRITELLGCPEHAGPSGKMLADMWKVAADLAVTATSDIRLYRKSDIRAVGELKEGLVRITYSPRDDLVHINLRFTSDEGDSPGRVFTPFIVRDDGTFELNRTLAEELRYVFDSLSFMVIGPIHETAERILSRDLRFYHPFARWFNEGVSNWVVLRLSSEIAPEMEEQCRAVCLPGRDHERLRTGINLYSWPQNQYSKQDLSEEEKKVESVSYLFATEAIERLMADQPPDAIARIIRKLKGRNAPDTETICSAVKEVTGRDFRSTLLEYVPEDVRKGLKSGEASELISQARSAMLPNKDYCGAYQLLTRALWIDPTRADAQFNLAYLMRKLKMPNAESERRVRIAAGLTAGEHRFDAFEPEDPETAYLIARMTQYAGNVEQAKEILRETIRRYPDHADARNALEELEGEAAPGG